MRTIYFVFLSFLLPLLVSAQDEDGEPNTLFDQSGAVDIFLGYSLDFISVDGDMARSRVWSGGVMISNHFMVGGYTSKLKTNNEATFSGLPGLPAQRFSLELQQGGVLLGVFTNTNNVVHFGLSSQLGWGRVVWRAENSTQRIRDNIFSVMPRAEIRVNLVQGLRFQAFGGYQMLNGYEEPDNGPLDSIAVGAGLILGVF